MEQSKINKNTFAYKVGYFIGTGLLVLCKVALITLVIKLLVSAILSVV